MDSKKEIVILILSLTPRERRFFKKTYDSENEFVKLFDYIVKYKSFSVSEFNEFLANSENRKELYTSGYISTIRQYLRDKLLESLRKLHAKSNPTMELWNDLGVAQILMNKGLVDIAKKELNASYQAKDRLFPLESLTLLQRESIFKFNQGYNEIEAEAIQNLFLERKEMARQHMIEIELAQSISLLSYFLQKNINDKEQIKMIEGLEAMNADFQDLCFTNQYLFEWAHAQLHLLKNDVSKAFFKFYKVINLWLAKPETIQYYPDIFIGCCQYYLKFTQYRYSENFNREEIQFIKQVLVSFRKAASSLGLSDRIEKFISYFELTLHVLQDEFEKVLEKEPKISRWMAESTDISQFSKNYLNYLMGNVAFRKQNYQLCLEKTESIIFDKSNLEESPLYYTKANLLYLMCHYSSGNIFFVQNELKKRERLLTKAGQITDYEKLFFEFLHHLFLKRNADKKEAVIEKFKLEFSNLIEKEPFNPGYRGLPIFEWMDYMTIDLAKE